MGMLSIWLPRSHVKRRAHEVFEVSDHCAAVSGSHRSLFCHDTMVDVIYRMHTDVARLVRTATLIKLLESGDNVDGDLERRA